MRRGKAGLLPVLAKLPFGVYLLLVAVTFLICASGVVLFFMTAAGSGVLEHRGRRYVGDSVVGSDSGQSREIPLYHFPLTIPHKSDKIPPVYGIDAEEYAERPAKRAPGRWKGERDARRIHRGAGTPTAFRPVGVLRERPLPRGSVLALHEAVSARRRQTRGGTAYLRPLSAGTGGVLYAGKTDFMEKGIGSL